MFQCIYSTASITGSIISSTILNTGYNGTIDYDTGEYCGANDCPDNNITDIALNDPDDSTVSKQFFSIITQFHFSFQNKDKDFCYLMYFTEF